MPVHGEYRMQEDPRRTWCVIAEWKDNIFIMSNGDVLLYSQLCSIVQGSLCRWKPHVVKSGLLVLRPETFEDGVVLLLRLLTFKSKMTLADHILSRGFIPHANQRLDS